MIPHQCFITGTDTDVGKTVVSAILAAGLQRAYWKPIQSGCRDTDWVAQHTGISSFPSVYCFKAPLSPHEAAALEGKSVDLDSIHLPTSEALVVEGAGGIMAPINERFFMIDLIKKLQLPVILVCRSVLGTLNHTLLSLHMLRQYEIPIIGLVMNGPSNPANARDVQKYGKVKLLAHIEPIPEINTISLKEVYQQCFQQT